MLGCFCESVDHIDRIEETEAGGGERGGPGKANVAIVQRGDLLDLLAQHQGGGCT